MKNLGKKWKQQKIKSVLKINSVKIILNCIKVQEINFNNTKICKAKWSNSIKKVSFTKAQQKTRKEQVDCNIKHFKANRNMKISFSSRKVSAQAIQISKISKINKNMLTSKHNLSGKNSATLQINKINLMIKIISFLMLLKCPFWIARMAKVNYLMS